MSALKRKQNKKIDGNQKISYDVPYIQFFGSNRIKYTEEERERERGTQLLCMLVGNSSVLTNNIDFFPPLIHTALCWCGADVLWTYFNTFVCSLLCRLMRVLVCACTTCTLRLRVFTCIVHTHICRCVWVWVFHDPKRSTS